MAARVQRSQDSGSGPREQHVRAPAAGARRLRGSRDLRPKKVSGEVGPGHILDLGCCALLARHPTGRSRFGVLFALRA
jgi:hypothetical protein